MNIGVHEPGTLQMQNDVLRAENESLRRRLQEAEETLAAIRAGDVDAFVVGAAGEERVYALETADAPYRLMVERMAQGAATVSPEGVVLYANGRLAEMLGLAPERLFGARIQSFARAEEAATLDDLIARGLSESCSIETRLEAQGGGSVPVFVGVSPLRLAPETAGVSLIVTGLTAQKHHEALARMQAALRESEQNFRAMFEVASVGKAQVDLASGRFLRVNAALCAITGYSDTQLRELTVRDITHPDDREADAVGFDRMLRGATDSYAADKRYRRPDGSTVWVRVNANVLYDTSGRPLRTAAVIQDITAEKLAADALRESEGRFRILADSAPVLVWVNDLAGCVTVNRTYREFVGVARDADVQGEDWTRFVHADDRERYVDAYREAMRRQGVFEAEFRFRRHDGEYRWMKSVGVPRLTERGELVGYVGSSFDIHDLKTAQAALEGAEALIRDQYAELDQIYRYAPVGLFTTDRDCRFRRINERMADINGLAVEAHIGRTVEEIVPDLAGQLRALFQPVLERGEPVLEVELHGETSKAPGMKRDWLASYFPLRSGNGAIIGLIGAVLEITERKRVEEALREADRRKDAFLATLAHELRNPLAPIRNAVAVLSHKGPPDAELVWSREVIARQVRHMSRLLDDLLDVARISRDRLELRRERVTLAEVVASAIETSRPLIEAAEQALAITLPETAVPLDADPMRLAQVFANLLTNASKYTDRGGHIRLDAVRAGPEVSVSVTDDGIGIEPDMLPHLFEMFTQTERARERAQGGLGIGLALVRGLVDLHGGRIEARSGGAGRGSTFVVHLPVGAPGEDSLVTDDTPRVDPPRSLRILVADDNTDSADSLALLLTLLGHEVTVAYDGESALAAAERVLPQVLILDVGMPKLGGLDVARAVRAEAWGRAAILVAVTGWGREDDRSRTRAAGFDLHMVKPVDAEAMMRAVDALTSTPPERARDSAAPDRRDDAAAA
jgi:PAS domain S-box-containing protein